MSYETIHLLNLGLEMAIRAVMNILSDSSTSNADTIKAANFLLRAAAFISKRNEREWKKCRYFVRLSAFCSPKSV